MRTVNAVTLVLRLVVTGCLLTGMLGCATYPVRVTTYHSRDLALPTPASSVHIGVVIKTEPDEPLLEAEVGRKIAWLLEQQGYTVTAVDECEYMLTAFVAIDSGTTTIDSYPVYHPGRTVTTHVRTHRGEWVTRTTQLPGRTTYARRRYTVFTSHLGLTLYQRDRWLASSERELAKAVVWRAIANGSGESSDLRQAIDYLLVATFEYFGEDSGRQVRVTVSESDPRVESLRQAARGESVGDARGP